MNYHKAIRKNLLGQLSVDIQLASGVLGYGYGESKNKDPWNKEAKNEK